MTDDMTFDGVPIVWDDDLPNDTCYLVPTWLPRVLAEARNALGRDLTSDEFLSVWIHGDFRQLLA